MTRDEVVEAWERGCPVVNTDGINGDLLYLRISALIYRRASTEQLNRGYPEKYLQVELEPMSGANSVTITIPAALRMPTPEEMAAPRMYPERPESPAAYKKPVPRMYATPEARKKIMSAEEQAFAL
ncbi:MAG: hypothetical protein IK132_12100 [Clostridia bacterium]|nr:hypothetical protein [Clostridia bacterium]